MPSLFDFLQSPESTPTQGGGLLGGGGLFAPKPQTGLTGLLNSDEGKLGLSLLAASLPTSRAMHLGDRMLLGLGTYGQLQDRDAARQQAQLGTLKTGLELQKLMDERRREQAIRSDLARVSQEEKAAASKAAVMPMLDSQPTDSFGTAGLGGVPMFSMDGAARAGSMPAATYQAPQPRGEMRGAMPPQTSSLTVGHGSAPANLGASRSNYTNGLSSRFVRQAEVYAANGDFASANKLYEQAAKWMPEVHKIEVAMHQGQPVNVITMKDGRQVLSAFAPTPKVHWADNGSSIIPVNEHTMQPMGSIKKTMTPGETASNQLGWANHGNARDRLNFDRQQAGKPQFHEGQWVYPPSQTNPQGSIVQPPVPAGAAPKLTEVQGNATQFATRMRDAAKVIEQLESGDGPWPSTVARAGYDPQFPSWLPGGQVVAGMARGVNNWTVPEGAQRYHQAQTNWVTANLRKESGAAIGVDEMEKEIRKWFPQPGDGQDVITQKAAARKVAEEAMLTQAGPGARQVSSILQRAQGGESHSTGSGSADWKYVNGKLVKVQ